MSRTSGLYGLDTKNRELILPAPLELVTEALIAPMVMSL